MHASWCEAFQAAARSVRAMQLQARRCFCQSIACLYLKSTALACLSMPTAMQLGSIGQNGSKGPCLRAEDFGCPCRRLDGLCGPAAALIPSHLWRENHNSTLQTCTDN